MTEEVGRPPDGGPADEVLDVGPYAGRPLAEIAVIDPGYLADLVAEGIGSERLRAAAARALLGRAPIRNRLLRAARLRGLRDRATVRWGLAGALLALAVVAGTRWSEGRPARSLDTVADGRPGAVTPVSRAIAHRAVTADFSDDVEPASRAISITASAPCGLRLSAAVPAEDAAEHVGTYQAVEFRVVRSKDTGRVTFLNSHDPYEGHFYVAVFPADYDRFEGSPERLFAGRCIVVQGMVELYKGAPQIVLRHPDDVRVLADEDGTVPSSPPPP